MLSPINDLIAVELVDAKKEDFVTPDKAKLTRSARVLDLGTDAYVYMNVLMSKAAALKIGDVVHYRAISEDRQHVPPLRMTSEGKEIIMLSMFDIVCVEKP